MSLSYVERAVANNVSDYLYGTPEDNYKKCVLYIETLPRFVCSMKFMDIKQRPSDGFLTLCDVHSSVVRNKITYYVGDIITSVGFFSQMVMKIIKNDIDK